MDSDIVDIILLAFLAVTAVGIVRMRNLFAVVMLASIYSLLTAAIFIVLDAVDVSFTEAAVGAGITTVLFLGTLVLTGREERPLKKRFPAAPLALVVVTGGVLIYATFDPRLPPFGAADAPAHRHVAPEYIADTVRQGTNQTPTKVEIPNIVTTVLASYRGYDTLGETVVIFTAGVAVFILLGVAGIRRRISNGDDAEPEAEDGTGSGASTKKGKGGAT